MSPDKAETIALHALGWLAGHDELLPVFQGSSGADTADLAKRASDPVFLASVLEFLTMDDSWVMEFCNTADLAYDLPLRALNALPGSGRVHWT